MNPRSLMFAAILATLGTPLVAAASPSLDPAHVYAPLSSWQQIQGGARAEPAGEDAGVATSYPLSSYSSAMRKGASAGVSPRNENAKETTYALSSYPTADRG